MRDGKRSFLLSLQHLCSSVPHLWPNRILRVLCVSALNSEGREKTMAPAGTATDTKAPVPPRVLIVDDEPELLETISDVVKRGTDCRLVTVGSVAEARKVLA